MARTVKPPEERRQEILSTARTLFIKDGYKNTSVADIAEELGVAQGLIFHYYKTKALLLYAVFDEIAGEEQAAVKDFIDSYPGRLIDCLELLFAQGPQHQDYQRLIADLVDDPATSEYLREQMTQRITPIVAELIERGNADGSWSCSHPGQTAVFMVHGIAGLFRSHADGLDGLLAVARELILSVLGAAPPAAPAAAAPAAPTTRPVPGLPDTPSNDKQSRGE